MTDHDLFNLAAKAALRGMGDVEPNPMVGAVISREGVVLGIGHHRRFGGLHAEREAIANARARGHDVRGATIHVTLEPCSHFGRQPPCVDAILEAGLARVVMAQHDPHTVSAGGAARLRSHGVQVDVVPHTFSIALSGAFLRRIAPEAGRAGLPWVIAKWAQTHDGRLETEPGEGRWISCAASRRRVHRLRSMVDAVVTGAGTVLADDPMLTARDVARVRRPAKRVVLDSQLRTHETSALVRTAHDVSTIVITTHDTLNTPQGRARRMELQESGVSVEGVPADAHARPDARAALALLASQHACVVVMIESGSTLLATLFEADLIDQALVHIAPKKTGETTAQHVMQGYEVLAFPHARHLQVIRQHRIGVDTEVLLGRVSSSNQIRS